MLYHSIPQIGLEKWYHHVVVMLPVVVRTSCMVNRTLIPSVCHFFWVGKQSICVKKVPLDLNLEWNHCFVTALFHHVTATKLQESFD